MQNRPQTGKGKSKRKLATRYITKLESHLVFHFLFFSFFLPTQRHNKHRSPSLWLITTSDSWILYLQGKQSITGSRREIMKFKRYLSQHWKMYLEKKILGVWLRQSWTKRVWHFLLTSDERIDLGWLTPFIYFGAESFKTNCRRSK